MKLRYDPFQIFKSGKSPAALYARHKWLGEADTIQWKQDYNQVVANLLSGQDDTGSWGHSVIQTIRHLFGLHLTVRDATVPVQNGLNWLMNHMSSTSFKTDCLDNNALLGLPFTKCRTDLLVCGATLFLCSIFGRENDLDVLSVYARLTCDRLQENGRWGDWSCSNNVLRAFVVHPRYSRIPEMEMVVRALAHVQDASGKWPAPIPFFQTVNALAHLDSEQVMKQLTPAFNHLQQTQNPDGSWGRTDREWNTFLTLHALKNKEKVVLENSGQPLF